MFIGHFGVGFAAKRVAPNVSLGTLFLAAQFLDLLWPTLLLLDLEQVRIVPGATAVTPLIFENYPISHSLVAVLGWAVLIGGIHYLQKRKTIASLVLGMLVLSHWLLDAIVHSPDLPLIIGSSMRIGLNVWSSLPLTVLIEGSVFALGVWLYIRATYARNARGSWGFWLLIAFLVLIYIGNLFGSPPPDAMAIAWVGQAQWLLVLWAYWIDMNRSATESHPVQALAKEIP